MRSIRQRSRMINCSRHRVGRWYHSFWLDRTRSPNPSRERSGNAAALRSSSRAINIGSSLCAARTLGVTIPETFLTRANKVIEKVGNPLLSSATGHLRRFDDRTGHFRFAGRMVIVRPARQARLGPTRDSCTATNFAPSAGELVGQIRFGSRAAIGADTST
jgi:hypothetical protein